MSARFRTFRRAGSGTTPFALRNCRRSSRKRWALLGFALDQFVERTRRDGAALVILAAYDLGGRGDRAFGRLHALAAARGIPVINQHDYIVSRGQKVRDAHWPRDAHWSPAGHQWAADALLEHLRHNPQICRPRV